MPRPDLNLLVTLAVLLEEGSVAAAARRLALSPSAMSRALARLRATTGDPLLVRAGRGLVPTPRAEALRAAVAAVLHDAESVLAPSTAPDPADLDRSFTLRTGDGFVESFGPSLIARIAAAAPKVRLRFLPRAGWDDAPLRQGAVDLETAVLREAAGPELRTTALFADRFVGVARSGHPDLARLATAEGYAGARHVEAAAHARRPGAAAPPVEAALAAMGLERDVAVVVGGFSTALALARATDLVATVPERHTGPLRAGMATFALPVAVAGMTVSMVWHPRLDADPAHHWLRGVIRAAVAAQASPPVSRPD